MKKKPQPDISATLRGMLQPSLRKRLTLVLTLDFVLVWGVLFGWLSYEALSRESGDFDKQLLRIVNAMGDTLQAFDSKQEIQLVMQALHDIDQRTREAAAAQSTEGTSRFEVYFLVTTALGEPVYHTPGSPRLPLQDLPSGFSTLHQDGFDWHVVVGQSPGYRVYALDRADLRRSAVLGDLAPELVAYVVLAFIIVLSTILLAVRRGLAPLQTLSARIAARSPDDLSPIDMPIRHRELRPIGEALDTLLARARKALTREKAFIQDAAHELRTPLAVISAQAHLLAGILDTEARRKAVAQLGRALDRASRVTGQLLNLAQLEGSALVVPGSLDLMLVISEAIADFTQRWESSSVDYALTGPDKVLVAADKLALRSILDNLIDNAVRHGDARHIEIEVVPEQRQVKVLVIDDGCGIADTERQRIFERFHRGRSTTGSGAGLGLTIARQAAEQMGGSLQLVTSEKTQGTVFELRLQLSGITEI